MSSKFSKLLSWLHCSRAEEGQAMVMVAFSLVVIIGFGAFAVDIGHVAVVKADLQNAADAAALAAAQDIGTANNPVNTAKIYAEQNGVPQTSTSINPTNTDPTKIEVVCAQTVQYYFAGVLGFKEKAVTARAVAQKTGDALSNSTFGYAVFAGDSQLKWNGGSMTIGGDIYGDKGISFGGTRNDIIGNVVYNSGTIPSNSAKFNYTGTATKKKETMPDFSQLVKDQATANGNHFANQTAFKAKYYDWPAVPAVPATPAVYKNGKLVTAAKPGTPEIPAKTGAAIDGPIWVDGALTIDKRIHGKGIIYADGTYKYTYQGTETASMSSICFYSSGGITFNGGSGKIGGILYAPNGTVTMNGTPKDNNIFGRMIAKNVTVNGNGYTVVSLGSDLDWLETLPANPNYQLVE